MRFNESAMKVAARTSMPEKEGRLQYRGPRENYRERWFKLKGNLLFFFRTNEFGQLSDTEAIGVLVLEWCNIQLELQGDTPFAFSIEFSGDPNRKHYFSGQTQQQCEDWVTALTKASIENLKAEIAMLQTRIEKRTGKSPVESIKLFRRSSPPVTTSVASYHRKPTRTAPRPPAAAKTAIDEALITLSGPDSAGFTRPWVKAPVPDQNTRGTTTLCHSIPALAPPPPATRSHTTVSQEKQVATGIQLHGSGWEIFE